MDGKEVIHNNNNEFLATKLQSGITVRAVSDGSYHPTHQYGTSAWIIKIQSNDRSITEAKVFPGDDKSQCYHCSKLRSLIGAICNIYNISSTCNVIAGSAELVCDGLEAYKVETIYLYAPSTKLSHYDLSSTLHQLIKASPMS